MFFFLSLISALFAASPLRHILYFRIFLGYFFPLQVQQTTSEKLRELRDVPVMRKHAGKHLNFHPHNIMIYGSYYYWT